MELLRDRQGDGDPVPVSTGMTDDRGYEIFLGDTLQSEDGGFLVIVQQEANGVFTGKLVCDPSNSCANIPYCLNDGSGYVVFEGQQT